MSKSAEYFILARNEERCQNPAAALLLYLSSFCSAFNNHRDDYPFQATEKIIRLQKTLHMQDEQLLSLVHSYGPLTNDECRTLLAYSIQGDISGINMLLSGGCHGH